MAAAREQATRGWLESRDAVLARWRVAFVLAPLVLVVRAAGADEQTAKRLTLPARPAATSASGMHAGAARCAMPPPRLDEAIEPAAFGVKPTTEETDESLEVPERPALAWSRRLESVVPEEPLLSPAPPTPTVSEEPLLASPASPTDGRPTAPDVAEPDDEQPAEMDVLSLIRMEIRQRLPYFEGCARSARRRNGLEIRRLQATWAVAADGSIKDMKVDGIDDPEFGACMVRIGSRPFTVHPGVDLVIPTPIVFVR